MLHRRLVSENDNDYDWATTMKYQYPCLRYQQLPSAGVEQDFSIVCLVAPCDEILAWAGIPRKQAAVSTESVDTTTDIQLHGYQREAAKKRINDLVRFYQSPDNVIPTSILLARRFAESVRFIPSAENADFGGVTVESGILEITTSYSRDSPFNVLLHKLCNCLEARHPSLQDIDVDAEVFRTWKEMLTTSAHESREGDSEDGDEGEDEDEDEDEIEDETGEVRDDTEAVNPYSPDNHIEDFYKEIRLRERLCLDLPFLDNEEAVLGLTKEMVLDYLAPVTVVDGQHRLIGANEALTAASAKFMQGEEAIEMLASGGSGRAVEKDFKAKNRRVFSATMMLHSDWTEHVFQFVVVNQKVKPISKALLSSIISTSLNSEEISSIQDRLQAAGIEIDDYRVMGRLIEDRSSPFFGYVKKGFSASKELEKKKLEWAVLSGLASDFRSLVKWTPYDLRKQGTLDPAKEWRNNHLLNSQYLAEHCEEHGLDLEDGWGHPANGVWIDVFFRFFWELRNKLTDSTVDLARWGERPSISNIFNGATMRTMLADFFSFLHDKEFEPSKKSDFDEIVVKYFSKMKKEFFARKWNTPGNRVDRTNMSTLATYLRNHRKTGKIDGKWNLLRG